MFDLYFWFDSLSGHILTDFISVCLISAQLVEGSHPSYHFDLELFDLSWTKYLELQESYRSIC